MSAWLFDIALSAVLNAGRFDLGFYAGRLYGLMAATLVLLVLLIETGAVYARLARSFEAERDVRDRQLHELQSELIHVSRLTELGQMVSALAHEVNQPLTAAGSYVRAGRRLVQAGDVAKADEALQKGVDQVTRASQVIQRLRQFVKKADGQRSAEDIRQIGRGGGGARAARCRGARGAPGDEPRARHAAGVHRQGADPAGAAQSDPQCRRGDAVEPASRADHQDGHVRRWHGRGQRDGQRSRRSPPTFAKSCSSRS